MQKNALTVVAKQDWHTVKFDLTIDTDTIHGRFGTLTLLGHMSSKSACFEEWSQDLVNYKVPEEQSRFVKDPRL